MIADADLFQILDSHFDRAFAAGVAPGISYGLVRGQSLIHHRGLGGTELPGEGSPGATPDADTVFRIASMTKSFTGAVVLSMRDEGLVSLDAPVATHLPALSGSGWAERVTVRHLMTMSGGFLTDDPWGDRQQALSIPDFVSLLEDVSPSWRSGRQFEYSNMGYAIIGLVIEAASNRAYREVVSERILRPLGMSATGFDPAEVAPHRIATGYVQRGGTWQTEPLAGHGAFAPMGGLLSSVRDVAQWVGLMLAAEDGVQVLSCLTASSLREMQTGQRFIEAGTNPDEFPDRPGLEVRHYGFGLFEEHLSWGRAVFHSGGYPGFGSHMRWHPETGLGIVALANRTYSPMGKTATAALADLVARVESPVRRSPVESALSRARRIVTELLNQWSDSLVHGHFAGNVGEDEPWDLRRAEAERLRERHGRLRPVDGPLEDPQGPGYLQWWLAGERSGHVRCEAMIGPAPGEQIQWMRWQSVPEPAPEIRQRAEAALGEVDPDAVLGWPLAATEERTTFEAAAAVGRLSVTVTSASEVVIRRVPAKVAPFDP